MSIQHPGGDPNANLYAQLKRDVLERVPHITAVEYVPDDVQAKQLQATFDPTRLDPQTGPEPPKLIIAWYRQTPHDWFRVNYTDPNTGFHAGWHQDEDQPNLGRAHFQYKTGTSEDRWGITFKHNTPSLILWEIIDELLEEVLSTYQSSTHS
ncbi:hypothetical protein ACFQS4_05310 [Saliphagus sp. GCM10025317]